MNDIRQMKCFCAEDEQTRACWTTGLRLIKVITNKTTFCTVKKIRCPEQHKNVKVPCQNSANFSHPENCNTSQIFQLIKARATVREKIIEPLFMLPLFFLLSYSEI